MNILPTDASGETHEYEEEKLERRMLLRMCLISRISCDIMTIVTQYINKKQSLSILKLNLLVMLPQSVNL